MRSLLKITALAVALATVSTAARADRLVILHTNDTHSQIDPDDKDGLGGVARRKVLVDSVRMAEENVMLVDAGDAVQGTLYFNLFGGEVEQKVMNALEYDLRILGNHEFDNGVDSLAAVLADAEGEFLATNYDLSRSPLADKFHKYTIREVDGRRIGFIAINLRPEGMISEGNYDGVGYLDALTAANSSAWWLKNIENVDMVVALTHIGYDPEMPPGDVDLAGHTSDIDIIIGGHSHDLITPADSGEFSSRVPNLQGREILVTQVGKSGKNLGKITIDLDSLTTDYEVIRVDSRLDSRIDDEIPELIAPYRRGVDSLMREPVAKAAIELPQTSAALLNFCTDMVLDRGRQLADSVDMAMLNKGGIRRGLPKGTVTEGQLITMMPFNNRVQVIDIKGADILPALQQMARVGGSGVSEGVEVVFTPRTADTDAQIVSATLNGEPIDPERTYRVATIDYMAKGGDYMPTLANHRLVAASKDELYKDLITYLRKGNGKGRKINPSRTVRMHMADNR
ncbi:MAG: bifunctional UDP-sugar hydrolase/5'-nucleotidase [Bacteroidales bacterium]|nr:bifunctional UDP-sugar hydrolase/5'-nucleotidase [Bacteroidales bacterium]